LFSFWNNWREVDAPLFLYIKEEEGGGRENEGGESEREFI